MLFCCYSVRQIICLIRYVSNRETSLKDSKVLREITHDSLKSKIALFSYMINVCHSTENILGRSQFPPNS